VRLDYQEEANLCAALALQVVLGMSAAAVEIWDTGDEDQCEDAALQSRGCGRRSDGGGRGASGGAVACSVCRWIARVMQNCRTLRRAFSPKTLCGGWPPLAAVDGWGRGACACRGVTPSCSIYVCFRAPLRAPTLSSREHHNQ